MGWPRQSIHWPVHKIFDKLWISLGTDRYYEQSIRLSSTARRFALTRVRRTP